MKSDTLRASGYDEKLHPIWEGAMSMDKDVMESRIVNNDTLIIYTRRSLNASCEKNLEQLFFGSIDNVHNILLNLADLSFMDTEGAGLIVILASRAAQKNIGIAACGLTEALRDVFRLTRLDEAMSIFVDEKTALSSGSFAIKRIPEVGALSSYEGDPFPGWARSKKTLSLTDIPFEAMNLNVEGREPTSPVNGFGQLWDKKYRLHCDNDTIEPAHVVSVWKSEFPNFWPKGNRLFPSGTLPIAPGTTAVLNLALPGGLILATGIMVIYADDTSFSFSTVQGHILAGWITFSSFRENSSTIIQVHPLFRSGDPLIDIGFRFGAAKQEDRFWHETLGNLAGRLGIHGSIEQRDILVDTHIQWGKYQNLWYSAAIRSSLYMPFHLVKKIFNL